MKLLLTTLNSKYVHSCLAIRYLEGYSEGIIDTEVREYTINQNIDYIVAEIYKVNPDIVGFSTYIWNKEEIMGIAEGLKLIKPNMKILLGGPEVTFDAKEVMKKNEFIDFIIYGEGEVTFSEFIKEFIGDRNYKGIDGLVYRVDEAVVENNERELLKNLDSIPSPYQREIGDAYENKIIYYESSRGCPFNCKFCLSSTLKGVRYFDIERVKKDLGILIDARVRQVKFVDRTFNANKEYAMEIMNFIMDKDPKNINFHFEVTAHLLDEEMLDFLSNVKEGLFQFEVGVQSTNDEVIKAVGRTTDFPKLREVTKRIKSFKRIHQHLDLIAGLPYEDYISFGKSFDDVYEIRPEKIQLGFLKLLKGSELRALEDKYGFKYINKAPYEVLETNYIDYKHIRKLKGVDNMVDNYYNEEIFKNSIEYVVSKFYNSAFKFFEELAEFYEEKGYHNVKHNRRKIYDILMEFYRYKEFENVKVFNEILKLDFIENNKGLKMPDEIEKFKMNITKTGIHDILKNEELLLTVFKDMEDTSTRELLKNIQIERYSMDILEFLESGRALEVDKYLMTVYLDGILNTNKTVDITNLVELINN